MKYAAVQFITIALIVNCVVGLFCIDLPEQRILFWQHTGFTRVMFTVGMGVAIFTTLYLLLQAVLAAFYRAAAPLEGDDVPQALRQRRPPCLPLSSGTGLYARQ